MDIQTIADRSIEELRAHFLEKERVAGPEIIEALRADRRAGVRAIAERIEARKHANRAEAQRLRHLLKYETEIWESGLVNIAGVDEAGMSPLAGPVVAGAVILQRGWRFNDIDDSKVLDAETRERLAATIKEHAVAWAVGVVSAEEIDKINIYRAGLLAMRRAVEGLAQKPDYLLIDARSLRELAIPQQGIIKGDAKSLTIASASIVAKTHRDGLMLE